MNDESEKEEFEAAAMQYMLHGAWRRWLIRLAIGITLLVVIINRWPDLWWLALIYLPAPIFSAVWNVKMKRKYRSPRQT